MSGLGSLALLAEHLLAHAGCCSFCGAMENASGFFLGSREAESAGRPVAVCLGCLNTMWLCAADELARRAKDR